MISRVKLQSMRLGSHGVTQPVGDSPEALIQHYGCLQAQDIRQAKWVIGSRLPQSTIAQVEQALTDKLIVRTRPMRGTLHYMDPDLVHVFLDVCASRTLKSFVRRRECLGMSGHEAQKALELLESALRGGKSMTRLEIDEILQLGGLTKRKQRIYHITCYAGTRGLLCFGPSDNHEETFVLLDERITKKNTYTHEEKLALIAKTYYTAHGPQQFMIYHGEQACLKETVKLLHN